MPSDWIKFVKETQNSTNCLACGGLLAVSKYQFILFYLEKCRPKDNENC